tara:strand:- start:747 stop:932 length:186 start_codon:yes stop_codon:yes gene_type:complete
MKYNNIKLNKAAQDLIIGQKNDYNYACLLDFLYKNVANLAIAESRKYENILKLENFMKGAK